MPIFFTFVLSFLIVICIHGGRVVITLYALALGARPFTVGIMAAMLSLLPTLLSWNVGRFCDRFGARWPLLISTVVGGLGMLAAFLMPGIPVLFITSVLYGTMTALSLVPLQNIVGLLSGPEKGAKNFSNFSLVVSFVGFAGPMLAGFSFDHQGPPITCLFVALLLLVPAVMLILIGGILPHGTRTAKPTGSVRTLLSESGLWRVLATTSMVAMGVDLFQTYMPIYGNKIGLSASAIGVILALYSLAAFVIRFFLPYLIRKFTIEGALAYSFLIAATGFMLVPFFDSFVHLSLVTFLYGLGMGCGAPITLMMTFSTSTEGRSGEAMGLRLTVNNLTRVVSQVFFGSIASAFGVISVFWILALALVSGGVVSHPRVIVPRRKRP